MENKIKKVIIIGPAHPIRGGGMTTINHRIDIAFQNNNYDSCIYSYALQYPKILFPGSNQYTDEPAPKRNKIITIINSINPFNWIKVGQILKNEKPDLVIIRFWIPFMGPALGTIARIIKKNKHSKILALVDNLIPHEKRKFDKTFTNYFLKPIDAFITLSDKVSKDFQSINNTKPVLQLALPALDTFEPAISQEASRSYLKIPQDRKVILFFGLIRKYKGLDMLLQAMNTVAIKNKNIYLVVAGEFYEGVDEYHKFIKEHQLESSVNLQNNFIPDSQVHYYLCAADALVQPYRNATQSGVTPLAFNYLLPTLVTNVGGLPKLVDHGKTGVIVEPNADSIAQGILELLALDTQSLKDNIQLEKQKHSWERFAESIVSFANDVK